MSQQPAKIITSLSLLAFLLAACKFTQVIESLPPIQPSQTASPAPPTATPAPTQTPTPLPTATLFRGTQYPANGHWYLHIKQERSWHTAHEYCRGMGAHLVTIGSEAENAFVYNLAPLTWLGATDEKQEGTWAWITGEPMNFTRWADDEPNNCSPPDCQPENYLTFSETSQRWSDVAATELPFICEWDE